MVYDIIHDLVFTLLEKCSREKYALKTAQNWSYELYDGSKVLVVKVPNAT